LDLAQAEASRLVNGSREETRALARARLRTLELEREQARTDVERAQRLFQQSATTERDRIAAEKQLALAAAACVEAEAQVSEIEAPVRADELRIAQAKVAVAEAELELAEAALEETLLRAPSDGTVLRINALAGETTHSLSLEPVIVIADTSRTRVRAFVEELDALSLAVGDQAVVLADGRGTNQYPGRIEWIAPSMQAKSHRTGKPTEHFDVSVREVVIGLEGTTDFPIGLPVEVYIQSCGAGVSAPATMVETSDSSRLSPGAALKTSENTNLRPRNLVETARLASEDDGP
jgi:multidrug resistance efflux pump